MPTYSLSSSLDLAEYNFKLTWAPGSKNPADTPSRCPDYTPQEGDPTKNPNFLSLLNNSHVDWLHEHSASIYLSSAISFNSAALFTLVSTTFVDNFQSSISSDSLL